MEHGEQDHTGVCAAAGRGWRRASALVIGVALLGAGMVALGRLLGSVPLADILDSIRAVPPGALVLALVATAASYGALIGHDRVALRMLDRDLPLRTVATGGFLGYAFGNTVGFGLLSGGAVRYRIYAPRGLTGAEVAAVSGVVAAAFGAGVLLAGLLALAVDPRVPGLPQLLPPAPVRYGALLAAAALLAVAAWLSLTGRSLRIRGMSLSAPPPGLLSLLLGLALADIVLAALALFVLLPPGGPGFAAFLGTFAVALMAGVVSHVPAGIGVFEAVILAAMPVGAMSGEVAAALLLYRLIYHVLPLALALACLVLREAPSAARPLLRLTAGAASRLRSVPAGLAPFAGRARLLLRSVSPPLPAARIGTAAPEAAAAGNGGPARPAAPGAVPMVPGGDLLRGMRARRVAGAVLAAGAVIVFPPQEDGAVMTMLAAAGAILLWRLRRPLRRGAGRGRITALAHPLVATTAVMGVMLVFSCPGGGTGCGGFGAMAGGEAVRVQVVETGAGALLTALAVWFFLRPAPGQPHPADGAAIRRAAGIVRRNGCPSGALALTGDKALIFDSNRDAFIMYGVHGRSWIACGDPVGPDHAAEPMVRAFRDAARTHGARAVLYRIGERHLPSWIEMGYALCKIGEEAVVDLTRFSLSGRRFRNMRSARNRARKEGITFAIHEPPHDPPLLESLHAVSDAWLRTRAGREKGFSVGRFDPAYLQHTPVAVLRRKGRVVAFANILVAGDGKHLAVDLMRHLPEAGGLMEVLFVEMLLHYRDAGAAEFSLGMAPLAGLDGGPGSGPWNRLGSLLFRHGGAFYNFAGLRAFKQKFRPEWRPRFVAVPPGVSVPLALIDVALLVSGGVRGVFGLPSLPIGGRLRFGAPHRPGACESHLPDGETVVSRAGFEPATH